jgi:phosphatidylglycerol---prolipoprotein diacylglyceryl transferase
VFPTLYEIQGGALGIHTWGVLVMLAFVAGCLLLGARGAKVGIDPDRLMPFFLIITFGGLFGSRLLHFAMAEPKVFFSHPLVFFDPSRGGFAFYGGAIFSTLAGALYAWFARIPVWKLADTAAPSVMLGLAIGRLGCFFAGCCHGRACDLPIAGNILTLPYGQIVTTNGFPWMALVFHKGPDSVGDIFDVPLFPTQLWESFGALILFLFLSWEWKRARRFDGQILATLMMTYPLLRSTIEGFRGDAIRGTEWFGLFSTSQVVSIPVFALGLLIFLVRFQKGVAPEAEVRFDEEDEPVEG